MPTTSYIALGSNLEEPGLQLQRAVDEIDSSPSMEVTACSRLYLSEPLCEPESLEDQPDYCNAVVAVSTELAPLKLLDSLQAIENHHGRIRTLRWEPRTLDLDILLYGEQVIHSERLTLPHYQMHVRNFVLCPLQDIAPELMLPNGKDVAALVNEMGNNGLKVIAECYPWF